MKYTRSETRTATPERPDAHPMQALLWTVYLLAAQHSAASTTLLEKEEAPHALLSFFDDPLLERWATLFTMTTASGACYEIEFEYGVKGNMYNTDTLQVLLAANWIVEGTDDDSVSVYGARTNGGQTDPVVSLVLTNRLVAGKGRMPELKPVGAVNVEVRTVGRKRPVARHEKLRSSGPEIANDPFVEFDLSTFPPGRQDVSWELNWEIRTAAGEQKPLLVCSFEVDSLSARERASLVIQVLAECGFKAEIIGGSKFRVYGGVHRGRYFPVTKGSIKSPQLRPEDLPRVTNPRS